MSPERIKGQKHSYDSDIWSVGLTIAECGLGKFPFDLTEVNIWSILQQVEKNSIPALLTEQEFSPEFRSFVGECMKFDPKERPSASKLLEHAFVKKYETSEPSLGRWVHDNYVKKRKELAMKAAAKK